ncbi:MAG: PDZ domain-containing protein [Chlorobi bacterium]|nr:PDZ domain-containing protein [Chlorobiota bacterium]MCI0717189.1 PDZ domain-containing protein [Chlorobiota bacterium]
MTNAQNVSVNYSLAMPKPSTHYFEVEIFFDGFAKEDKSIDLTLPVWRPGRYLIFDFASGVQDFEVYSGSSNPLKWFKTDKSTWRVETNSSTKISVKYKVFANEFSLRTRGLDDNHGFVNGTSVFMYSEKYRKNPLTLKVMPYNGWHVTTGLDNTEDNLNEFTAPDYDYLADCPLEIGTQTDFDFDVEGRKHIISIYGEAKYDRQRLIDDFTKIIKKNYDFWGNVPYEKYVFIIHINPHTGGGTEHINSTVLAIRPQSFETEAGYAGILRLVSHEFFHTWNVKQLKPKGLTPYDYSKENYTSELWIAEGGTSYYDGLMLVRTGQMKAEDFYKEVARGVEDERRRPGNRIQSVAESSFDAWVKFWKRTPNAYNSESDYYGKGSYVCLVLDLEIRNASKNRHSLDDVFKAMYERFPLDVKGYTNEDFQKTSEEFAGVSLQQFFDDYVYGTKPIEWEKYLSYAGLKLKSDDSTVVPVVGIKASRQGGKIIIDEIITSSSAENAGLMSGDEIIAYDGSRLSYEDMEKRIKVLKAGDKVKLTIFRADNLKEFTLILEEKKLANYYLWKTENPNALQKEIYEDWLEVRW